MPQTHEANQTESQHGLSMLTGGVRVCKHCHKEGHTAFNCPFKSRAQIKSKKPLRAKKRLSPVGPLALHYRKLRASFFEHHNQDTYYCYYCKYIGLDMPMGRRATQVEHFLTKARHPELRYEMSNLVPSCAFHNQDKGGLDGPEYLEKLDKQKENIWQETEMAD